MPTPLENFLAMLASGRDAPLLASFAQPRALKTSQRISSEAIVKLDNPL